MLVGFDSQQVIGADLTHSGADGAITGYRVDGDDRTLEAVVFRQALQHYRDGDDFVRLFLDRLLAQHQPAVVAKAETKCSGGWPTSRS